MSTLRPAVGPIPKPVREPKTPRRLKPVGEKRAARFKARRAERERQVEAPAAALVKAAELATPARSMEEFAEGFNRALGVAAGKRQPFCSEAWLEAVRSLPRCAFCQEPRALTSHHFPGKGAMGIEVDVLTVACCGDRVQGCHGRAQRYEIPEHDQLVAVGQTIAAVLCQQLDKIPQRDRRKAIRKALIEALLKGV